MSGGTDGNDQRLFRVDRQRVIDEAGSDLMHAHSGSGKLLGFADWLYGHDGAPFLPDHVSIRYAQSIITRSESELLGISSPRFAFRAYLGDAGFVNIRRRWKIVASLRSTPFSHQVQKAFINERHADKANWIADCLLTKPKRLASYHVLTCNLADDYGEKNLSEVTPFVTHVDFGGGLCAQAACFMALGLSGSKRVYGIAEITSEAVLLDTPPEGANEFRVRGLTPHQIERFFQQPQPLGVNGQRQGLRISDNACTARVAAALRAYLYNNIPLLQIVSLSRMLGEYSAEETADSVTPVYRCDSDVNHGDYSQIPIGLEPKIKIGNACHCIVIVGCSESEFIVNDPASFPFLTCDDEQLVNFSAYEPADDGAEHRHVIGLDEAPGNHPRPPKKPAFFQCIAVTPASVELSLLPHKFIRSRPKDGLFAVVDTELSTGYQFDLQSSDKPYPSLRGEFYVVQSDGETLSCPRPLPATINKAIRLIFAKRLGNSTYWLHHTEVSDIGTGRRFDSLWFWDASSTAVHDDAVVVFIYQDSSWVERGRNEL